MIGLPSGRHRSDILTVFMIKVLKRNLMLKHCVRLKQFYVRKAVCKLRPSAHDLLNETGIYVRTCLIL